MKRILLFLAILFSFNLAQAQVVNWTGVIDTDWDNPLNWDTFAVPGPGDEVDIMSGGSNDVDIFPGTMATAKRVKQNGNATLYVHAQAMLTIDGVTGDQSMEHSGTSCVTTNDGDIVILNNNEEGLLVKGTWTNNGSINISGIDDHHFRFNGGNFTNNGTITITNSSTASEKHGMQVDDNGGTGGVLTNNGIIDIVLTATAHNKSEGIDITDGSQIINSGSITVTCAGGGDMGIKVRKANSKLDNLAGATITVNNTIDRAISIEETAILENSGTLECSNSLEPGVDVKDGTFNNNAGALYKSIGSKDGVHVRAAGTVNNAGDMWLDLCSSEEIEMASIASANWVNTATATFHPGSSPGDFEIKFDYDLGPSCTTFEINGTAAGTDYDQYLNFGNAANGSNFDISGATAKLVWGYTPAEGDCYKIVDGTGDRTGMFATVTDSGLAGGFTYTVDYSEPTEVIICIEAVVPVELVDFSGRTTDKGNDLNWETASEVNNEGFEIQRSKDGENWTNLGFVEGQGNTHEAVTYSFLDESPAQGSNYYRLKQMDFDGAFEYSNTINLRSKTDDALTVYPNPVNDLLFIDVEEEMENLEVQVFDANGKLMLSKTGMVNQISFADFNPGVYFLSVSGTEKRTLKKVIKI